MPPRIGAPLGKTRQRPAPDHRLGDHRLDRHIRSARAAAGTAGHRHGNACARRGRAAADQPFTGRDCIRQPGDRAAVGPLWPPPGRAGRARTVRRRQSGGNRGAIARGAGVRAHRAGIRRRRGNGRDAGDHHGFLRRSPRRQRNSGNRHRDTAGADVRADARRAGDRMARVARCLRRAGSSRPSLPIPRPAHRRAPFRVTGGCSDRAPT